MRHRHNTPGATVRRLGMIAAMALFACAPEYELTEAGPSDDESEGTETGPGGDTGNDNPGGGGQNPWGHLQPGNLPEAYFIVAYVDWTQNDPYASCYGEPLRYAMIDLRGHVIAEFEAPSPDQDQDGLVQGYARHRGFLPSGPGQFVAISGTDYWEDWDCDAYGGTTDWYAWRGDGVGGGVEPLATGLWTQEGYATHLIGSDRDVLHGNYGYPTSLAMQPNAPDELMLWYSDATCAPNDLGSLHDLKAVNMADATIPDVSWSPDELLPSWMHVPGRVLSPFTTAAGVDADQNVSMLLGIDSIPCDGQSPVERWVTAYHEVDGITWRANVEDLPWPYKVEYNAADGGGVLYLPAATEEGQPWKLVQNGRASTDLLPAEVENPRVGPLLDASGPSFVVVASNEDHTGDDLVFMHAGRDVWRIKGMRFGLDRRDVQIRDVMLLPPVAD
ncbi:MAG: hypothetical protein KC912_11300 [Proteobacteria bacterium]|nr:hypothetical protein [Pseudomonadota bacterium]